LSHRMTTTQRLRSSSWILIAIVDAGFIAWGAMAALALEHLPGPGSLPILPAGYEGFTGQTWQDLASTLPSAAGFISLLFRVYGAYNVAFGLLATAIAMTAFRRGERWSWWALLIANTIALGGAMTYDWIANAIGPFELSEYLGLAIVYFSLAVTAPVILKDRPGRVGV